MQCEVHWLEARARLSPVKTAVIDEASGLRLTYAACNKRANRLASYLQRECRVEQGDRIAILSTNHLAFIDAIFACGKLGAILVPFNPRLTAQELHWLLQDCEPRVLLVHEELERLVASLKARAPLPKMISLSARTDDFYNQLVTTGMETYAPVQLQEDDPLMIIYTGGTTGRPKGAVLSHRTVTWNSLNTIISWGLTSFDCSPIYMPMFHTGGLNALALPLLHVGGTILIPKKFQADDAIRLLERERCTLLLLVPTMYQMLIQSSLFSTATFSHMKAFLSGGAPCPHNIYDAFWEQGLPFKEGYGLTEAGPNNFYIDPIDVPRKRGSVGKVMFHQQVRLIDEEGRDVPIGEVGELLIKGPHLFSHYWNDPVATSEVFVDGWLRTGDLAEEDEEGFFYIVGRKKEMLISGGENIYPLEVEHCIQGYEGVLEVAVVGLPHPTWGEQVTAALVTNGSVEIEALRHYCRQHLASYKVPKEFFVVEQIPKTAVGKLDRQELQAQLKKIKNLC